MSTKPAAKFFRWAVEIHSASFAILTFFRLQLCRKADFADPRGLNYNPRSVKRESGKIGLGKKIIYYPYSSMAPTLIGTEEGYAIHPDVEHLKLFKPTRGKAMVQGLWTGGASKVFASVHQQLNLGAQVPPPPPSCEPCGCLRANPIRRPMNRPPPY